MRRSNPLRARRARSLPCLPAILTALTCGCATTPPAPDEAGFATATVEVRNESWEDLGVYLVRGSTPVLVGTVPSMQTRRFRLERSTIGTGSAVALSAVSRVSGQAIRSAAFDLTAGERVEWVVQPNLLHSALVVR